MGNCAEEIKRLHTELLDKVGDFVRQQAEKEVRKAAEQQVRDAVEGEMRRQAEEAARNPTDENLDMLVDMQMQTDEVQAMIDANVEAQMATPEAQSAIDAEVAKPMQSAEVQQMIDEECARQMQPEAVQAQISSGIVANRSSAAYLSSVTRALEENGEDGEAYQALVTLRETLDDLMSFYDGLMEYNSGVAEAADGVGEARTQVKAMLSDGDEPGETIPFVSERNGAVKNVQFVMTAPAIDIPDEAEDGEAEEKDESVADRLLKLFH